MKSCAFDSALDWMETVAELFLRGFDNLSQDEIDLLLLDGCWPVVHGTTPREGIGSSENAPAMCGCRQWRCQIPNATPICVGPFATLRPIQRPFLGAARGRSVLA